MSTEQDASPEMLYDEIREHFVAISRELFPPMMWVDLIDDELAPYLDTEHLRDVASGLVRAKWPARATDDAFITANYVALQMSVGAECQRRWIERQPVFVDGIAFFDDAIRRELEVFDKKVEAVFGEQVPETVMDQRRHAELALKRWKADQTPLLYLSAVREQVANELGLVDRWNDLSSADLVSAIGRISKEPDYLLGEAETLAKEMSDSGSEPSHDAVHLLRHALQAFLLMQLARRKQAVETSGSKAAMEFLVNAAASELEAERSSIYAADVERGLEDAAKRLTAISTRNLTWHPELSGSDAKAEIRAMAHVKLLERLAPIMRAPDPLSARLLAAIEGQLGRIPERVRESLGHDLAKARDHRAVIVEEVTRDDGLGNDRERAIVEFSLPSQLDEAILRETLDTLSGEQRMLIEMSIEGRTQKEMASRLGISQPAVVQRLATLHKKFLA